MVEEKTGIRRPVDLAAFREGRDEMNLAELPLAAVSDRFLDGAKTVVFVEDAWDKEKQATVKRKLSISGSDLYGLPTAKDDDVLLACVQLSALGDFHSRQVDFSRYELLKLLRWPDETKYYRRLSTSLRRWKGLTVFSDRAFYDHGRKSWVSRDFGVFDNLYIFEREESEGKYAPAKSRFLWNEVLYQSFQSGYLKKLDWDLYLSLKDPVAKRLYRFLDKRFYRQDEVVVDLHELAFNKVRLSRNYNTAQVKRALMKGISELEAMWELRRLDGEKRFRKVGRGRWEAVFVKRRPRKSEAVKEARQAQDVEMELARRGVGPATGADLVAKHRRERIESMIELHDWYNARGQERGPGFVVAGIKSKEGFVSPKGFRTKRQQRDERRAANSRKRAEREIERRREAKVRAEAMSNEEGFSSFWSGLGPSRQASFEEDAVANAEPTKRDGYFRSRKSGGAVFEEYRRVVLRDHFYHTNKTANPSQKEIRP